MSNSIQELIDDALAHAQAAWEAVVPGDLANLHDLAGKVAHSLDDFVDKLTNNGTLPVPNPRDWLPEQLQPGGGAPVPPPPPPPPPPSSALAAGTRAARRGLAQLADHAAKHPFIYATAALGLGGSASYYWAPNATGRALAPLAHWVPLAVLPDPKNRPLRLVPAVHGVAGEVRKEAVVVLGADSPLGRELALDLERRGFVVVATVADPADVDSLERNSRGWLKVLVLNPYESSSVSPFLRSLSTALSLRYPLHSSGDPFARPAHALALSGVVNCLPLVTSASATGTEPYPLEATENDLVKKQIGERVATMVGAVRGLLPILRTAAGRPGAPTGVLLSLLPAASTNLSLPFASLASAADGAIASVLHSLRREISASTSQNVRVTTLETGFFQTAPVLTTMTSSSSARPSAASPSLPIRLESIYAPALARRARPTVTASQEQARNGRKGTEVRKLCKRVWQILVRPAHVGAVTRSGSGSYTYLFVSFLPHAIVDLCLGLQDRLYGLYLSHVRDLVAASSRRFAPARAATGRGPLPTPPAAAAATESHPLRPGPAQVPLADSFASAPGPGPGPGSSASATGGGGPPSSRGGYSSSDEASSQSSTEEFGSFGTGGSSSRDGSASMGGSFVSVGREDGRGE